MTPNPNGPIIKRNEKKNRAPSGQRSDDEAGGVSKVLVGIAQEAVGDPHKPEIYICRYKYRY